MANESGRVLRFPFSRVPMDSREAARDLGPTPLTRALASERMTWRGHWCSHCLGIWYSGLNEIECPACGNRHG